MKLSDVRKYAKTMVGVSDEDYYIKYLLALIDRAKPLVTLAINWRTPNSAREARAWLEEVEE